MTVTSSTFGGGSDALGNSADQSLQGGGAILDYGTLTVTNSTFDHNHARNPLQAYGGGGAIDIVDTNSVYVGSSQFANNDATNSRPSGSSLRAYGAGGAICNLSGTMTVFASTFTANHADHAIGRGAIFNSATMTVTNSTLGGASDALANSADQSFSGGGAILNSGTLTVTNSTLASNHADGIIAGGAQGGGGIMNSGTLTVTNSTLYGNHD